MRFRVKPAYSMTASKELVSSSSRMSPPCARMALRGTPSAPRAPSTRHCGSDSATACVTRELPMTIELIDASSTAAMIPLIA